MDGSLSHFEQGVKAFKSGLNVRALECFNLTLAQDPNTNSRKVYDSRCVVLRRLERFPEALKDARKLIEIDASSPQGYFRSAQLFLDLSHYESASRMLDLAGVRTRSADMKMTGRVVALKEELQSALARQRKRERRSACYVNTLPFELMSEIFMLVAVSRSSRVLTLCAVCQRWRTISLASPRLWKTVSLSTRSPLEQLKLWSERSSMYSGACGVINLHLPRFAHIEDAVDVLKAWSLSPRFQSPADAGDVSLSFEEAPNYGMFDVLYMRTAVSGLGAQPPNASPLPLFRRLRHLDVNWVTRLEWEGFFAMHSLRTIRLRNIQGASDLANLIRAFHRNPGLELLHLSASSKSDPTKFKLGVVEDLPSNLIFAGLNTLVLESCLHFSLFVQRMETPNLKRLVYSHGFSDFPQTLLTSWSYLSSPPPLVELRLHRCGIGADGASLAALVKLLPLLEVLHVTNCGDDVNPVFRALAGSSQTRASTSASNSTSAGNGTPAQSSYCPRLHDLDFSGCSKLKGVSVRDLVRSRILPNPLSSPPSSSPSISSSFATPAIPGSQASPSSSTSQAPESPPAQSLVSIRSLVIDRCPSVEASLLPWFRQHVHRMSCAYETKAVAKERLPKRGAAY